MDWTEGGGFFGLILSIPVNAFIWGLLVAVVVWQMAHTWAYENESLSTNIGIAVLVVLVAFLTWRRLLKRPGKDLRGRHTRRGENFEISSYKVGGTPKARVHNQQWGEELLSMNRDLVRTR